MGGLTALAVAAGLEREGERVGFVGLLDTWLRVKELNGIALLEHFPELLEAQDKVAFAALSEAERNDLVMQSSQLPAEGRLAHMAFWGKERGYWLGDASVELIRLVSAELALGIDLTNAFEPVRISAPLHVWWAGDSLDPQGRPPVDWGHYTSGGARVEIVNGSHEDIVRNPLVGASLKRALEPAAPLIYCKCV